MARTVGAISRTNNSVAKLFLSGYFQFEELPRWVVDIIQTEETFQILKTLDKVDIRQVTSLLARRRAVLHRGVYSRSSVEVYCRSARSASKKLTTELTARHELIRETHTALLRTDVGRWLTPSQQEKLATYVGNLDFEAAQRYLDKIEAQRKGEGL